MRKAHTPFRMPTAKSVVFTSAAKVPKALWVQVWELPNRPAPRRRTRLCRARQAQPGGCACKKLLSEPVHEWAVKGERADRDGLQGANRKRALLPAARQELATPQAAQNRAFHIYGQIVNRPSENNGGRQDASAPPTPANSGGCYLLPRPKTDFP